jgi:hypothetical protein
VQTLRERGNRDGKGLFRSSSERGHGVLVTCSSFAAGNYFIYLCEESRSFRRVLFLSSFRKVARGFRKVAPFTGETFFVYS